MAVVADESDNGCIHGLPNDVLHVLRHASGLVTLCLAMNHGNQLILSQNQGPGVRFILPDPGLIPYPTMVVSSLDLRWIFAMRFSFSCVHSLCSCVGVVYFRNSDIRGLLVEQVCRW